MPGRHELGHHRLGAHLGMAHIHRATLGESVHQCRWQHQIAQAQCRESHFAEGADVEHPPLPIKRRQRCQWRAAVTVFAIVIILDDPALGALGPGQQFQPPRQTHHHPGRVLMRRRDIGQIDNR